MSQLCNGIRVDGQPCRMPALSNDSGCWAHSAHRAEQRRQARSAGGRGHGRAARAAKFLAQLPSEYHDILTRLRELMDQVEAGSTQPRQAEAICALANTLLNWLRFASELRTADSLEERFATIEADAAARRAQ